MSPLPVRSEGRKPLRSAYFAKRWVGFVMPVVAISIILQILFLGNMSYLYGVLFKSGSRAHALKVLAIDYDGGEIGQALSIAYQSLEAKTFPTVEYHSASEYSTPELLNEVICKGDYWAAIYTHSGASKRLMATIEGQNTSEYDPGSTISYIYDASYYPIISTSVIQANMETLIAVTSRIYYSVATDARAAVNLTDATSYSAFLNPIQASSQVQSPTNQGTRVLLNTVSMVMPTLMQFFFLMAMNGIFGEAGVFNTVSKRDIYLMRLVISKAYTFMCALCMTGYIWAFREDWAVTGRQFGETWMCLWLYMEISYLLLDTVLDPVIPMKFFPFFLLTWIITNVASTIYPFALSAGFYRLGYALPAHNTWTLLMEVWSGGCKLQNEVALPVLLAWWVLGHVSSAWSVRNRCIITEGIPVEKRLDTDTSESIIALENV
ncbi:hypothetical protein EDB81DRAFT_150728 [Dactylonectria macrodidyma]|uniref:DUF3533 domain-containing protein n=1 Tax=Dactylonectria macrodidyma TaxID=307937 RepID=A0A9P9FP11_9HYPO|nr:hypothetical protein EDB81DRAFT_150728 [Dactylonectria macrodidyma]